MIVSRIGDENIGGVWWSKKEVMKIVLVYGAASRSDKNLAGTSKYWRYMMESSRSCENIAGIWWC